MKKLTLARGKGFLRENKGALSIQMAFAVIPFMAATGAAIDFGRSIILAAQVQSAVDQAALTAANMSGSDTTKKTRADALYAASMLNLPATSSLVTNPDGTVTYAAAAVMPTMFTPFVAPTVTVGRSATAKATLAATPGTPGTPGVAELRDDSCILSLGEDLDVDFNTLVFNGNPSVMLTNCSLISNKSMKCNGNNVGAAASYARGSIQGCPNPHAGQEAYPDIYEDLRTNISRVCGNTVSGFTWTPSGTLPAANGTTVRRVSQSGYTQIHICGNLTLTGTGTLSGAAPTSDTIIVIENGGLIMADNANVTAKRTSIVLAGPSFVDWDWTTVSFDRKPVVTWPTGNGKIATLTLSSSTGYGATTATTTSNPWKGMAIYQHPWVNVDQDWKPGARFNVDGIVYFSRAKLTVSGNISYGAGNCSKLVAGEFTLNGNVALKQDASSCAALGVTQYYRAPVPAVAAVAGTDLQSSYLVK